MSVPMDPMRMMRDVVRMSPFLRFDDGCGGGI